MKKTLQVINELDMVQYVTKLQQAILTGFQLQSSNAYSNEGYAYYFAVLIKEEIESNGALPFIAATTN